MKKPIILQNKQWRALQVIKELFGMLCFYTFIAIVMVLFSNAYAEPKYRVVDGDTLYFNGVNLRLSGIDTPELKQVCKDSAGKFYNCGETAKRTLEDAIKGDNVYCTVDGKDRFNRIISTCYVDGIDINAMMVYLGQAVAYRRYSELYILEEEAAKEEKRGIWQGEFEMPWDYRKNRRKK